MAADISLSVRWIPSELNIADKASRRWEAQRKANASIRTTSSQYHETGHIAFDEFHRGFGGQVDFSGDDRSGEEEKEHGKQRSSSQDTIRENSLQVRGEEAEIRSSTLPGADHSRETGSVSSGGCGLQQKNARVEDICIEEQASHDQEELGRGLLQVCEQFVRSRVRPPRRKQNHGGSYRQPPRLFPSTYAAADKESFARLVKGGASVHAASSAVARPGEAMDLQIKDLVAPLPNQPHYALHLHPAERREQSKVGLSDESLLLDSSMMPWLGPALLKASRTSRYLLDLSYNTLVQHWKQALVKLGLEANHAVLYQLRRSGPSHDRALRLRSALAVKHNEVAGQATAR